MVLAFCGLVVKGGLVCGPDWDLKSAWPGSIDWRTSVRLVVGLQVAATRGPCWALLDVFARARRLGVASC